MAEPTPSTSSGRGLTLVGLGSEASARNRIVADQLSLLLKKMTIEVSRLRQAVESIDLATEATSIREIHEMLSAMRITGRGNLFQEITDNIEELLGQYLAVLSREPQRKGNASPITFDEIMSLDGTGDPKLLSVKKIWNAVEGFRDEARVFADGFYDVGNGKDGDDS